MKRIWNDLINLFFPNLCLLCKKLLIDGEEQICLHCLCNLPYVGPWLQDDNPIIHLLADRERLVYANAFLHYQKGGRVQRLIHRLKYYDNKELGYLLGRQAGRKLLLSDSLLCQSDYLIPVPLHRRKMRQRGYNQSEWIALGLQSVLNIPLHTSSLYRLKKTESQTDKMIYTRWLNVKDVFTVFNKEELEGKSVLLVDDVITTGSTLGACVDALSEIPSIRINIFVLSMA